MTAIRSLADLLGVGHIHRRTRRRISDRPDDAGRVNVWGVLKSVMSHVHRSPLTHTAWSDCCDAALLGDIGHN